MKGWPGQLPGICSGFRGRGRKFFAFSDYACARLKMLEEVHKNINPLKIKLIFSKHGNSTLLAITRQAAGYNRLYQDTNKTLVPCELQINISQGF